MEIQYIHRFNNMNPFIISQNLPGGFPDNRIHMNRINSLHIGMFITHTEHVLHRLSKIFSPVCRDHNKTASFCPLQFRMRIILTNRSLQCINGRISRHIDSIRILAFLEKILPGQFRRCKIIGRDDTDRLSVKFFRIRRINIVGTKSCLHMPYRNLQIEAGQSRHKRSRSISMHQHHIWMHFLQHLFDPIQNVGGHVK